MAHARVKTLRRLRSRSVYDYGQSLVVAVGAIAAALVIVLGLVTAADVSAEASAYAAPSAAAVNAYDSPAWVANRTPGGVLPSARLAGPAREDPSTAEGVSVCVPGFGVAAEAGSDAEIPGMVSRIAPESLNMTRTVDNHLGDYLKDGRVARPYMNSPLTIQENINGGEPVLDPGSVPGALRWDVPGGFRGSAGTWELVINTDTNTILHFNFVSGG